MLKKRHILEQKSPVDPATKKPVDPTKKPVDPTKEKTTDPAEKKTTNKSSVIKKQENLVGKGYFIGTSGPNKNGVDGVEGNKTKYAQHALDSGIDASTYNYYWKQQNPELTQTIEGLFGKQEPKQTQTSGQGQGSQTQTSGQGQGSQTQTSGQAQGGSTQTGGQVQKSRVIKTIHPKNW